MIAVSLVVVAVGCDGRPARDPSSGTTTTTAAPSDSYGTPASATVYSSNTRAHSTSGNRSERGAGAHTRVLEEQLPDGSMTTSGENGNTRSGMVADPNAKPVGNETRASHEQTNDSNNKRSAEQDRPGEAVGVGDQGNSSSETKITADIRKRLVVSSTLSFSGKNVKVITTGSKVTLRGTVKGEQEKAEIEGIARATNGVTEVDSQLEVKK
jgi:osmotically-inducible protein OsmY